MKTLQLTKKIILLAIVFLFTSQIEAQTSVGGGLGYNQKIAGPGITLKGVFQITDKIAISPSASYFFGNSLFGYKRSVIAGDVNAHYYFNIIESKLKVYPVAGLNFSSYKTGNSYSNGLFGINTEQVTDNAFGANIGAGATWAFSKKLRVYLEPKYIVSNYRQVVINAGVLLKL
jgi:hypothetical protein